MLRRFLISLTFAAVPLGAAAQELVVNDIYQGGIAAGHAGGSNPDSPAIQAWPTTEHYCPDGLQPVVVGGAISCGTPDLTAAPGGYFHAPTGPVHAPAQDGKSPG